MPVCRRRLFTLIGVLIEGIGTAYVTWLPQAFLESSIWCGLPDRVQITSWCSRSSWRIQLVCLEASSSRRGFRFTHTLGNLQSVINLRRSFYFRRTLWGAWRTLLACDWICEGGTQSPLELTSSYRCLSPPSLFSFFQSRK